MRVTFVVMSPHYWGKGETLAEAKRNLRKQGGSSKGHHLILEFGEDSEFAGVDELGRYHWDGKPPTVEEVNG
jgi:hypothetical protein